MPRKARAVMVDSPHHITQRGNNRQDIFFTEQDRAVYLDRFFEHAKRYELSVWGYCLMRNHVHIVGVPHREETLARVFCRTHSDYARYLNLVRGACGHLFQARFYSCALDSRHAWEALAYVERNPVRAGLVQKAEQYQWSTARVHLSRGLADQLDLQPWRAQFTASAWREVLRGSLGEHELAERIREATGKGLPLGDQRFVAAVESALGRDLRGRGPGRLPKSSVDTKSVQIVTVPVSGGAAKRCKL